MQRPEGGPGVFMFRGPEGRSWGLRVPEGRGAFGVPGLEWLDEGAAGSKPRLGVTLQPLTDQMADFLGVPGKKGVLVTSTVEGSPAAGKLKAGDVIVRADSRAVEVPEDLTKIVREKEAGGKLELRVIRDKKEIVIPVDLAGTEPKNKATGYRL
jgi:S1-C subfamily serine protease